MLKKHWKLIGMMVVAGIALCLVALATTTLTEEGEKEISIAELPEAVKATILAEADGGTIEEIEMETENGETVYEAEVIIDGQEVDIEVAADGTLLEKETEDEDDDDDEDDDEDEDEEQVSMDQVPAVVRATILAQAGNGTIEEIDLENEDGQTTYEADVTIDGQEVEIKVAADGTLLGKEIDEDDDD
jgi:uncharacterized membrane protein YkoI